MPLGRRKQLEWFKNFGCGFYVFHVDPFRNDGDAHGNPLTPCRSLLIDAVLASIHGASRVSSLSRFVEGLAV